MGFIANYFGSIGSTIKDSVTAFGNKETKTKAVALMAASLIPGVGTAIGLVSLFAGVKGLSEASAEKKAATTDEQRAAADKKAAQSIFAMTSIGNFNPGTGGLAILSSGNLVNTLDKLEKPENKEILQNLNQNTTSKEVIS